MTATTASDSIIFGVSTDMALYGVLVVSLVLFILDIVLWFMKKESYKWYVGGPYEPADYLLPPVLGQDDKVHYIDSIAAAFYRLMKEGYLKVVLSKEKAIMGEMTKIKVKKVSVPSDKVLFSVYTLIPDAVTESGLFGEAQTDLIDIDDLHTYISKLSVEKIFNDYKTTVDEEYEEKYGNPRKSVKVLSYIVGIFSLLWAGVSGYIGYTLRLETMSYGIYTIALLLVIVGILMFRIDYIWSSVAKKFRGRWIGFKRAVVSGDVQIDDFYELLGYALALGISEHYLDVVKKQIVDGKVKVGKPPFADVDKMSFSDIRALVSAVNMLAGSLGGTSK